MPTTLGLHNHQSSRSLESAIYLPDDVKTLPELFRDAGYYTFNRGKDDYNFMYRRDRLYDGAYVPHYWYGWAGEGHWRHRQPNQPFFGQIQLYGGKEPQVQDPTDNIDRNLVDLPPYYPDHPVLREEWAKHHDCIRVTDQHVGALLEELRADGLLENTIVFFFSDHGMKGMRHKQFCYDGGLHVPLIITDYRRQAVLQTGAVRTDLVSSIDVAATSLTLAGIPIPEYMESRDLFASDFVPRDYIIAGRDRCDFTIDHIRAVRTQRYKYLRNFLTDRPLMQPNYRDGSEPYLVQKQLYAEGKMTAEQAQFWSQERPAEELYDLQSDPHEIHNLADNPQYSDVLEKLRAVLENWMKETDDQGQYPESVEGLRFMYERHGERCVNPEFEIVRNTPRNMKLW